MFNRMKRWWTGEFVDSTLEHILDENESGEGHFKRPWLARAVIATGVFLNKEWKWVVATSISLLAIYIAYLKL